MADTSSSMTILCPACSEGKIEILQDQIDIPHFGEVMISTFVCEKCGYKSSDIIPLQNRKASRHTTIIDDVPKLSLRVVRSGTSSVRIPEIGAEIEPGLHSEGFISNVEGVIRRFIDILDQIKKDLITDEMSDEIGSRLEKTLALRERLEKILSRGPHTSEFLTLIIEDPMGNSAIIEEEEGDVTVEELSEEEIVELLGARMGTDTLDDL